MAIKERNQKMRVIAEILLVHLPVIIKTDQALAHDLLAVAGTALRDIWEDAEQSAKSWDKRAYHSRADDMRREWNWALGASNYATGLALRTTPLTDDALNKVRKLIVPGIDKPARKQIQEPGRFRGAAAVVKQQQASKKKVLRE